MEEDEDEDEEEEKEEEQEMEKEEEQRVLKRNPRVEIVRSLDENSSKCQILLAKSNMDRIWHYHQTLLCILRFRGSCQ
ncbi:hypothetical protein M0802_005858 [Mischocyttarus mexicanus]|nr:hypothetical protein M0802_005858 [Mischocyttarus mexicanus]